MQPESLVDIRSGSLHFSDQLIVAGNDTEEKIKKAFEREKNEEWNVGNGWLHYYVRNLVISNHYFLFDFVFFEGLLKRIDFGFYEEPVVLQNWDNWSEENEIKKRNEYDAWLNSEIGKNRNFEWGIIQAYYDTKGGGSGIVIIYS